MKDQVLDLVRYVSSLSTQRDKILQATGEKFNIFRVLNLSTSETRTHSAFLAELFNPKGSHGQGSVFLKLFVEQLGIKDFDFKNGSVEIEKFAGYIDADYQEGGRIDIVITDNNGQGIIIENKIYAGDQKNQLLRYQRFGKNKFINHHLIYLTLFGSEPSPWSLGKEPVDDIDSLNDFKRISYKEDIVNWLNTCKKEATHHPLLRETITQYINLLKELTGQTMDNQLRNEITERIIKGGEESIKAIFEIHHSVYPSLVKTLNDTLLEKLPSWGKELAKKHELKEPLIEGSLGKDEGGIYFSKDTWSKVMIGFGFENNKFFYGICRTKSDIEVPAELQYLIQQRLGEASQTTAWPWWQWYSESYEQTLIDGHTGELLRRIDFIILDFRKKLEGLSL
ncbi:MAG: PD-(D/E)XK nuclease family protein [Cyclobacteriaceae bacterium]|nr:PD-(D/E)XK nuclease family protein [Cyclobacteriaceae bacterium]